jgi:hypothetical protein
MPHQRIVDEESRLIRPQHDVTAAQNTHTHNLVVDLFSFKFNTILIVFL